jgi:hypothetical protein
MGNRTGSGDPRCVRAGNLHLAHSRRHVSFWNLVYEESQWASQREEAYRALVLPNEADRVLDKLRQKYAEAIKQAQDGLPDNPFASVRDGRLYLKRSDALEIPERNAQLRGLGNLARPSPFSTH